MKGGSESGGGGDGGWSTVGAAKKKSPPEKKPVELVPTLDDITRGRPKVLILLRGLPGSGKSTLVQSLAGGFVCSADDFFINAAGKYIYDVRKIREAHEAAQAKAMMFFEQGFSPVIVDNTNVCAWEAKAYVEPAVKYGYQVEILAPSTAWRFDPVECARRNRHGVPEPAIWKMLQRWEEDVTVEKILASNPPHFQKQPRPQVGGATRQGDPPDVQGTGGLEKLMANLSTKDE